MGSENASGPGPCLLPPGGWGSAASVHEALSRGSSVSRSRSLPLGFVVTRSSFLWEAVLGFPKIIVSAP